MKTPWEKTPSFLGGNIHDIISKIDYIKNLGFNTIWLSPFYKGTAYHGYHIENFNEVDSRFGSEKNLSDLISKCHTNNMKVIVDFVPNHCSYHHPFFIDAIQHKESPYRNWFYIKNKNIFKCFLNFKELPKLNLYNEETSDHILKSAKWLYDLGVDGLRIDHVAGVAPLFLKKLKSLNKNKMLIGEAWSEGTHPSLYNTLDIPDKSILKKNISQSKLQLSYNGLLDGILDFEFRKLTVKLFKSPESKQAFYKKKIAQHLQAYKENFQPVLFLDNHDVDRIMYTFKNNRETVLKSFEFLISQNKPFCVYYGTEIGMTQKSSIKKNRPYADLEARRPMEWDKIDSDFFIAFKDIIYTKL